jgi:hypothetical protein
VRLTTGSQQYSVGYAAQLLDGEFAIDHGNDNTAILRLDRSIYNQKITIVDAKAGHRTTFDLDEERCFFVFNQVIVEIDALLGVIVSGRRETRRNCLGRAAESRAVGLPAKAEKRTKAPLGRVGSLPCVEWNSWLPALGSISSDDADEHAVYFELAFRANDLKGLVVRLQNELTSVGAQFFECEFIVDNGHDKIANLCGEITLDYGHIAIVDTSVDHRFSFDRDHHCLRGLPNDVVINEEWFGGYAFGCHWVTSLDSGVR